MNSNRGGPEVLLKVWIRTRKLRIVSFQCPGKLGNGILQGHQVETHVYSPSSPKGNQQRIGNRSRLLIRSPSLPVSRFSHEVATQSRKERAIHHMPVSAFTALQLSNPTLTAVLL